MLVLLMVASQSQVHAHPWVFSSPANHQTQAASEFASEQALPEAWLTPADLPHCHHDQAWRPASAVLPRSEAPDATPDPPTMIASVVGPSAHLTSPLGHAYPGPTSRPAIPLYLLTQRFRS
ncbi:hypothetical protein ACM26W_19270 [Halomonas sp. HK25]|uniref:hypothetical protein n=1 Tax=Halomonas sp. HK25 TaxID=3394321 RepID=UPI0039FBD73A